MADNSTSPASVLDFHPCDTPRGMTYYKLQELTDEQRKHLSHEKLEIIRTNQMYLKDHPEIRTLIDFLLKAILKARPKVKLRYFLAKYFTENYDEIKTLMERFTLGSEQDDASEASDSFKFDLEDKEDEVQTPSEDSGDTSLMCVINDDMAFDFTNVVMDSRRSNMSHDEQYKTCWNILNEIIDALCEDDIEHQVKLFSGNTTDSDPMLAFPFEPYLSDDDIEVS